MKNLKRTLCSLLAIILLAGVYVPCAGLDFGAVKAEAAALYTGIVTSSGPLNVRSGPSSTSKIITTLNQGTTVKITEVSGDFYKIDIRVSAYTYGYISKNYVKLIKEEGGGTKTGTVSSSGALNVRAKASTTATKIGTLNRGASVTILAAEGDFYKIEFRSGSYTYGYVYKSYITVASTPAQTTISGTVKTSSGGGVNVR
ncbi:MAG: SH3 domain-containing protein, partial [Clostridia bacterium]|nr:SH3 domain-containing protein [Clostridia bacterium]